MRDQLYRQTKTKSKGGGRTQKRGSKLKELAEEEREEKKGNKMEVLAGCYRFAPPTTRYRGHCDTIQQTCLVRAPVPSVQVGPPCLLGKAAGIKPMRRLSMGAAHAATQSEEQRLTAMGHHTLFRFLLSCFGSQCAQKVIVDGWGHHDGWNRRLQYADERTASRRRTNDVHGQATVSKIWRPE